MVIQLLIDDKNLKFIKDTKLGVRNLKSKIKIDGKDYDCIFENYTIASATVRGDVLPKSFSKVIIENITLSFKQVEYLMKCLKIKFNKMQWYANLEISGFKDDYNCKIQKLQFIEY